MKYTEVMVGRSETLPVGEFHNLKLYHQVTAALEENEPLGLVVSRLHEQCKQLLDDEKARQKLTQPPTEVNTKVEVAEPDEPVEPEPAVPDVAEVAEAKRPVPDNGGNGGERAPRLGRDTRKRPVRQLLKELRVRSPAHAGYLRAKHQLSYLEWKALQDYFSGREHPAHSFSG